MLNLENRVRQIETKLNQVLRVGNVSQIYPQRGSVRVQFGDSDNLVSREIPILVPVAQDNKHYHLPDIGEQVLAVFLPNGLEQGFMLGSFFSSADPVPVVSTDKYHMTFKDGTWLEYDRKSHKLTGLVVGDIELHAGKTASLTAQKITAKASKSAEVIGGESVSISAPLINLSGNLASSGSGGSTGTETKQVNTTQTGNLTLKGNLHVDGNISCTGSNPNKHNHE